MAKQALGLGTTADDGSGDTLRAGGTKINENFDELPTVFGKGSENYFINFLNKINFESK